MSNQNGFIADPESNRGATMMNGHSGDHVVNGDTETNLMEQTIVCKLCDGTLKSPKLLNCLHSYCVKCLEEYIAKALNQNGQRHFECPSCELEVEIPSSAIPGQYANSFQEDLFLNKVIELKEAMRDDKTCDICERLEEKIPADNFCMDCNDAMCENCLKVHLHGKFTSGHVVMSIGEMRKMPLENIMKQKNKVPCLKHNELITLFCVDCKDPLCVQCMAVAHRRCENVVTVADAMTSRSDVGDVVIRLQKLQASVHHSNGDNDAHKHLDDSIEQSRAKIIDTCNALCERVRQQQAVLLKSLDDCVLQAKKTLKDRLEPRKIGAKSIKAANDRMQMMLAYGSDIEILLAYNQVRKQLDSCQGAISNSDPNTVSVKVDVALDDVIERFMSEFEKIGEVSLEIGGSNEGLNSWGVTCTSTDDIIVTDCKNKRIQKFSKFGDLVDYVQLEDEPRDITTCGNHDDVAITMMGKLIIFLATRKTMQLIKRAKTERQYDGICFSARDAFLVVSSIRDRVVDIIQLDGSVLRSIGPEYGEGLVFQEPRFVSSSPDKIIVVSDIGQGAVVGVSQTGKHVFQYKPEGSKALKKPQGACVDVIGNLFVADSGNDRVQLLTNDGQFQRLVLESDSGLEKPVAIRVSGSSRMVIVQGDGMVKVFSYS